MAGRSLLYALATVVRAERWHRILGLSGVHGLARDCYGLTTVGYMGNNVLPARAGEALRVVLLDQRTTPASASSPARSWPSASST